MNIKNSGAVKFLMQKRVIIIAVYLVCVLLILLNLYLTHKIRPYNSDDVSWQNILLHWRPFNGNKLILSELDNFAFKLPFFIVFENLLEPSRRTLLIESAFFSIASFSFFYFAILKFMTFLKLQISYVNLLPVIWFSSFGYAVSNLSLNSVLRNIEMGLTFLLLYWTFNYMQKDNKLSNSNKPLTIVRFPLFIILSGILVYSDRYLFYFVIVPLIILFILQLLAKSISVKTFIKAIGIVALILLSVSLYKQFFTAMGITENPGLPIRFVSFDLLFKNIALGIESTFFIFCANFFGLKIISLEALSALLNAVILLLFIYILTNYVKKLLKESVGGNNKIQNSFMVVFFGSIYIYSFAIYTLSTLAYDVSTARYFIMALMTTIVFLVLVLGLENNLAYKKIVAILFITAIIFNFLNTFLSYKSNSSASIVNKANSDNFILLDSLNFNNLNKGYAGYWNSGINNYLSKGNISITPVVCVDGKVSRYEWLVDSSRFKVQSDNSFIIVKDWGGFSTCPISDIRKEFGPPEKIINIDDMYQVFVYPFDILNKDR